MEKTVRLSRRSLVIGIVGLLAGAGALKWFGTTTTELLALNGESGRIQWAMALPHSTLTASIPVATPDHVLLAIAHSNPANTFYVKPQWTLLGLNVKTGHQQWQLHSNSKEWPDIPTDIALEATHQLLPILQANTAYINLVDVHGKTHLLALNLETGIPQWHRTNRWRPFSPPPTPTPHPKPALYPGLVPTATVIVTLAEPKPFIASLQGLDPKTGKTLWEKALPIDLSGLSGQTPYLLAPPSTHPTPHPFAIQGSQHLHFYDLATGKPQSTVSGMAHNVLTPSTLFRVEAEGKRITAIHTQTSKTLWSISPPISNSRCFQPHLTPNAQTPPKPNPRSPEKNTPVYLYLPCTVPAQPSSQSPPLHWLVALNPKNGNEEWRTSLGDNPDATIGIQASTPTTLILHGGTAKHPKILAIATQDGSPQWSFPLHNPSVKAVPLSITGDRLFVVDTAPRWRTGLAHFIPRWH